MKKVLLVAFVAVAAIACKKDYTCTVPGMTVAGMTIPDTTTDIKDVTSKDAKELKKGCESGGGTWKAK